ncbi:50S ribosomal protein L7/L12 [Candidatus Woesebacteria bacterium]|nr:50S ribosomal protein L7/L12 [Candidatus Woesebacteria bacterium]
MAEKAKNEEQKKEAAAAEKKEEVTEVKTEAKKEEIKKEEKTTVELPAKLQKIAEQIEGLTVVELADLAKYLEEKFGVSSMPMMAAPMAGAAPAGAAAEPAEEKTNFDVVITGAGDNKLSVIKIVRELRQDLGLMDAKKLVESVPGTLLEGAKKEDAEEAKKKLEEAGASVELK